MLAKINWTFLAVLATSLSCEAFAWRGHKELVCSVEDSSDSENGVYSEMIPNLKGIILVGHIHEVVKISPEDSGVRFQNLQPPGNPNQLTILLSEEFLGKPLNKKRLAAIKETIVYYYRYHNRPIVFVQIPEQDITSGVLQVVVLESKMGSVHATGNKYFNNQWLETRIRQVEGDPIQIRRLNQDLTWINRNPFLEVNASFRPGDQKGTTDIDLIVQDRRPYRLYGGVDNTGLPSTGHNRFYAGFNLGNLWRQGHQFNYQFVMAASYQEFWAHAGQYLIPLPWRHVLQFFGGYSQVHAPILSKNNPTPFKTKGYSWQVSTRYDVPLWAGLDFLQEINFGFDFKRTNNSINLAQPTSSTGGEFVFGGGANIGQFMLGYNAGYERQDWKFNLTLESYYQPGPLGFGNQSPSNFNELREFAKNHYFYIRGQFMPIFRFMKSGIFWYWNFRGQYATQNLLSSEQMGVGGYDTVRGYDERQLNGDSAMLFSTELRSPVWHFFKIRKENQDDFQLLAFYDNGIAYLHKPSAGEPKHEFIQSAGPGLRYSWTPYITVRLDLGFRITHLSGEHDPHHKWHFAAIGSF